MYTVYTIGQSKNIEFSKRGFDVILEHLWPRRKSSNVKLL